MMASEKKDTGSKRESKPPSGQLAHDATWWECVRQIEQVSERCLDNYRRLSKGNDREATETVAKVRRILHATVAALVLNESSRLDGLADESRKLLDQFTHELLARDEQLMVDASAYAPPGREKWFVSIMDPIRGRKSERGTAPRRGSLSGREHAAQGEINKLAWLLEPSLFPWLGQKSKLPWFRDTKSATATLVWEFLVNLTVGTTWTEFLSEHDVRLSNADLAAGSQAYQRVEVAFSGCIDAARPRADGGGNVIGFEDPEGLAKDLFVAGLVALDVPGGSARDLLAAARVRVKRNPSP